MNKQKNKIFPFIVIILSTIVMQIHGIEFWNWAAPMRPDGLLPFTIGWAFSIALEASMLWLWYSNKRPFVRVVMAVLLIAGPLYQLTVPLSGKIGKAHYLSEEVEDFRAEVKQKEASLKIYQENSKKYRLSAARVAPAEASLDAARAKYREAKAKVYNSIQESGAPFRLYAVTAMEAFVLLGLLLTEISVVSVWRPDVSDNAEKVETHSEIITGTGEKVETMEKIKTALLEEVDRLKSQAALCNEYGFNQRDVSNVVNDKPISPVKLKEMAAALVKTKPKSMG